MYYPTIYQTTACKHYLYDELSLAAKKADLLGDSSAIGLVVKITHGDNAIPFSYPIVFNQKGQDNICIDVRRLVKEDPSTGEEVITNKVGYDFMVKLGLLNLMWVRQNPNHFLSLPDRIVQTYGKWVSENISKRFALNPRESAIIEIICACFYLQLFSKDQVSAWDYEDLVARVSRATRIPSNLVNEVLPAGEEPMKNLHDLVEAIKNKTGNVRLQTFSTPILFTLISRTWFGHDAPEMLAASLEHPPTFTLLVYTALNERLYRNTGLSKTVERVFKSDGKTFIQAVDNLIDLAKDER